MKSVILTVLSLVLISGFLFSQSDTDALIEEAGKKLNNNSGISQVLADKKYDIVHPETSFRDLIKKYAKAETLVITNSDEPGKKIKVNCQVKDKEGKPVQGALVYLYQTDARGWYASNSPHVQAYEGDIRHARLFGYVKTDKEGKFTLHTVKPSGYPQSDLPAHIHVHVTADGYRGWGNEFLFDDDSRLVGEIRSNSIRNQFLISKPEKTIAPFEQQFSYIIVLDKN